MPYGVEQADGLPGVIADRYADVIVLQTLTLAMDRQKTLIAAVLSEIPEVRHVVERNDATIRAAEALPLVTGTLVGEDPEKREMKRRECAFWWFAQGQKTGLYLDQLQNYGWSPQHREAGGFSIFRESRRIRISPALKWRSQSHGRGKRGPERGKAAQKCRPGNGFDFSA